MEGYQLTMWTLGGVIFMTVINFFVTRYFTKSEKMKDDQIERIIKNIENLTKNVSELTNSITKITEGDIKVLNTEIEAHEKRIIKIENKIGL